MRARLGGLLRRWADRIDPQHAPRKSGYSYTVERTSTKYPNGVAIHVDGTGCPFLLLPAHKDRAYSEAATDWRSPQQKVHDVFEQFGAELDAGMRKAFGPIRRTEDQ